jgi:hypothetical protein
LGISLAEHLLKRVGIPGLKAHAERMNEINPDFMSQNDLEGSAPNLAWLFHEARKELAGG